MIDTKVVQGSSAVSDIMCAQNSPNWVLYYKIEKTCFVNFGELSRPQDAKGWSWWARVYFIYSVFSALCAGIVPPLV